MADKIDLKKRYAELYAAKAEPRFVSVPELAVFAVDGAGDPNDETAWGLRMEALYAASYGLKFALKKSRGLDWGVMPPEGDWWCEDMAEFSLERREAWIWRLMIVQPAEVTEAEALAAIDAARKKKPDNAAIGSLRFERRPAHEAVHLLHRGPYSTEPPTIARLHAFIEEAGYEKSGQHREIYLGDPRKGDPASLKTIIRQPVVKRR